MPLPSIQIVFKQAAAAAVTQGATGIAALILKDASVDSGVAEHQLYTVSDIPAALTDANKDYARLALAGAPAQVKLVVIPAGAADYAAAQEYLETIRWNVLAVPGIAAADAASMGVWAKGLFETKLRKITAVLPSVAADHPAVVNFTTDTIKVGSVTYTNSDFTARIAGLIAGLPLSVSPTYQVLPEVTGVPKLTKAQADAAVDAGKLILYHDGEKVKIARGVTSFVTPTEAMGTDWKKIKVVRILNKLYEDIRKTAEDNYIGKMNNSYMNKVLLVSAINAYFEGLEQSGILDPGKNRASIDVAAQRIYLQSTGVDVTGMNEQQVKEANTDDQVFLKAAVQPLDAIEDIKLDIFL
ncbi:phage tail sheath C-terminal domain-containing protein [Paenibacillus sp. YN15]|uniref:phage tail sheath C-terminal domain-containing protein n=1 Tax=Paenibacillus sp. YN15 TaxID=1742774 RepID=UPI000DCD5669|nr:phage tail sheath C-terminal domain-containing protein [Paenibacillus sp. YN15]RAU93208.1 phage tail sheath protein [Paenibacillus sp. YN15]